MPLKKKQKGNASFPFVYSLFSRNTIQRRQHFLRKLQFFSSHISVNAQPKTSLGSAKYSVNAVTATPAPPALVILRCPATSESVDDRSGCKPPAARTARRQCHRGPKHQSLHHQHGARCCIRFAHRQFRQSCASATCVGVTLLRPICFTRPCCCISASTVRLASIDPSAGP